QCGRQPRWRRSPTTWATDAPSPAPGRTHPAPSTRNRSGHRNRPPAGTPTRSPHPRVGTRSPPHLLGPSNGSAAAKTACSPPTSPPALAIRGGSCRRYAARQNRDPDSIVDAAATRHVEGDDDQFAVSDVQNHAIVAHPQSPQSRVGARESLALHRWVVQVLKVGEPLQHPCGDLPVQLLQRSIEVPIGADSPCHAGSSG